MGVINIVKNAKEIHPEFVLIIRIGKFDYTYGKDSYIISYLCNYKLGKFQEISRCGFSLESLNRVIAKLEQNKINYMILDRKLNYDVKTKEDNKNLNNYNKIFQKAKKVINLKIRIENINKKIKGGRKNEQQEKHKRKGYNPNSISNNNNYNANFSSNNN